MISTKSMILDPLKNGRCPPFRVDTGFRTIQAVYGVVGDQDGPAAGGDAGVEGQQVAVQEVLQGQVIDGESVVGVRRGRSVAREVLHRGVDAKV